MILMFLAIVFLCVALIVFWHRWETEREMRLEADRTVELITNDRDGLNRELARYREKLKEKDERVTRIVDELSNIVWKRDRERRDMYTVMVQMDPRLVGYGGMLWEDREFLAYHVSERVAHEIISCKFIHKAADFEPRYGR